MTYHHDRKLLELLNLNPDKYQGIEIGNVDNFVDWHSHQPATILHFLSYGYFENLKNDEKKQVSQLYEKAVESNRYNRVLRFDGQHVRHPALLNVHRYFAEMSESYYGFNDHYPFLQFELAEYDPQVCELLTQLWGAKAK